MTAKIYRPRKITGRTVDITGQRFGDLEVLGYWATEKKNTRWVCYCHSCGTTRLAWHSALRSIERDYGKRRCNCPGKRQHPLIRRWESTLKEGSTWTFLEFRQSVGEDVPYPGAHLLRPDRTRPMSPTNVQWSEPGKPRPNTMQAVADACGITRQRVEQLRRKYDMTYREILDRYSVPEKSALQSGIVTKEGLRQ